MAAPLAAKLASLLDRWQAERQPRTPREKFNQRNLYILPTRFGWQFLLAVFLVWLLGTNYENNLVLLLSFFLVAVFVSGMFSTHANLSGLSLEIGESDPVFAGDDIQVLVRVRNSSSQWRRQVMVEYADQHRALDVPPQGAASVTLLVSTSDRGWFQLPRFTVSGRYPLGLLRVWSQPLLDARLMVWPQPVAAEPTASAQEIGVGEMAAGRGIDDFAGLEAWRPGVPVQRIAWKQFSAGRGMLEKTFQALASSPVWIKFQHYRGMDTERILSAMCARALDMERSGFNYGLDLGEYRLPPSSGERHLRQLLTALAIYPERPDA